MNTQTSPEPTPLPGIVATLKAGFDYTTQHWWLALIPALLDLFYWLGPRLSLRSLIEQATTLFANQAMLPDINEQLLAAAQQTNLFTSLTIPFIGIPTLMRLPPEATPLATQTTEVQSFGIWFALFIGFNIMGFLLTSFYFSLIAQAVKSSENGRQSPQRFVRRIMFTWGQLLLLALGLLLISIVIFFPLIIISTLLSLISPQLVFIILFSGMMLIFWLALFLGFTPHGLTLHDRTLRQAVLESVHLVRLNYTSAVTLLLVISGISLVMDELMTYADDGSWFTLSSILGHAFVSTALITTTYIFYRDRIAIQLVKQRHPLPTEQIKETSNG